MKEDLQKKLINDFPDLYSDKSKPNTESLMCYGFCCGNGWYELLRELSENITNYINAHPQAEKIKKDIRVVQVKEKFGGLRYYMTATDEKIDEFISKAERKSSETCELCGKPGTGQSVGNWMSVYCDDCYRLELKAYNERKKAMENDPKSFCYKGDQK